MGEVDEQTPESNERSPLVQHNTQPTKLCEHAVTAALIGLFLAAGPALIYINKVIMTDFKFEYPAFVSSIGLFSSMIVVHAMALCKLLDFDNPPMTMKFWALRVLPIGVTNASTLVLGNAAYMHLSIAFIQIIKAVTPVYVLIFLFGLRMEKIPHVPLICSVIVISVGTGVASAGELNFSWLGFSLQTGSSISEALKLVLMQVILTGYKFSPWESLYYVAPASALCMLCAILSSERGAASELYILAEHWPWVACSAVIGFFVNILNFYVIKRTSSLTAKVLQIVRSNGFVLVAALWIPGNTLSLVGINGYVVSLIGFIWYTVISYRRQHERMKQKKAEGEAPSSEAGKADV